MGISIYLGCGIRLFLHLNRLTISSNLRLLTSGCILRFYSLYVFSSYSLSLVLVHLSYFLHPLLCCFFPLNANSWTTPLLNVFLFPRFLTMAYALCPESMWYICLYFFFLTQYRLSSCSFFPLLSHSKFVWVYIWPGVGLWLCPFPFPLPPLPDPMQAFFAFHSPAFVDYHSIFTRNQNIFFLSLCFST